MIFPTSMLINFPICNKVKDIFFNPVVNVLFCESAPDLACSLVMLANLLIVVLDFDYNDLSW
jgi:hypothetical protein